MLNGKEYKASKVDIWSSGIVLFTMIYGFLFFENEDNYNEKLYKKIIDGNIPNFVSELGKDLIKKFQLLILIFDLILIKLKIILGFIYIEKMEGIQFMKD